eukprot:SAG31_NODE_705_length_12695_cov_3.147007_1_plen_162_part_00
MQFRQLLAGCQLLVHLLVFATTNAVETAAASSAELLPYPRSQYPTGGLPGAKELFVISEANITGKSDQVTAQTLSGVLARVSPVDEDTTVFWLHYLQSNHGLQFDFRFLGDLKGLLKHFAQNVSGYVKYDPSTKSTNAALIRCAAGEVWTTFILSPSYLKY